MFFFRSKDRRSRRSRIGRYLHHSSILGIERLERRDLPAIMWANEFVTSGPDDANFDTYQTNEVIARDIVHRAITDWNAVLTNFNYAEDTDANPINNLNNTFNLKLLVQPLATGIRGDADITSFNVNGAPKGATVRLDDNGGGKGWFFDATPNDDAEFTAIVNSGAAGTGTAFQASFIDVNTATSCYNDFYRTIVHEIGHGLGRAIPTRGCA
jgi:hypothetical protein